MMGTTKGLIIQCRWVYCRDENAFVNRKGYVVTRWCYAFSMHSLWTLKTNCHRNLFVRMYEYTYFLLFFHCLANSAWRKLFTYRSNVSYLVVYQSKSAHIIKGHILNRQIDNGHLIKDTIIQGNTLPTWQYVNVGHSPMGHFINSLKTNLGM